MPQDVFEVKVPQFGANEDIAILVEWIVHNEGMIKSGDPLCTLETTKTVFELMAEATGYVLQLVDIGCEVRINQTIALVGSTLETLHAEKKDIIKNVGKDNFSAITNSLSGKATKKAIILAKDLGIDLATLDVDGIIKEDDVKKYFNNAQSSRENILERRVITSSLTKIGFVNHEFLEKIEKDSIFGQLSSDLKVYLYKLNGADIGENVEIGKGSIIISRIIQISDHAEIGSNCHIKCERFLLGKMSVIGNNARIVTREVIIGDVFFSGEDVLVGGGGAFGPRSCLQIGNNCMVSSKCVLNTGEPIIIGDEVGLSPNVQLYTHNHWQNVLKGYSARHAQIVIENGAYITGNCLVVPGVRIGEGATVLANSVVSSDVDPYTVVSGVPAKFVSSINTNLSIEKKERIIKRILIELSDEIKFRGFEPNAIIYVRQYDCLLPVSEKIVLTFNVANLSDNYEAPVIFDLSSYYIHGVETRISDEVRNFLRRRGIRFKPIHWRYTLDKGFYVQ